MRLTMTAAVAALGLLAACGAEPPAEAAPAAAQPVEAATAQIPADLIRALYAEDHAPNTVESTLRYFTPDLAARLVPPDGEVGDIDWDYRIGAQDIDLSGLTIEEVASGPEGARVEARFTNFDETKVAAYDLCRRADGEVRIANIQIEHDTFDARRVLSLPAEPASC